MDLNCDELLSNFACVDGFAFNFNPRPYTMGSRIAMEAFGDSGERWGACRSDVVRGSSDGVTGGVDNCNPNYDDCFDHNDNNNNNNNNNSGGGGGGGGGMRNNGRHDDSSSGMALTSPPIGSGPLGSAILVESLGWGFVGFWWGFGRVSVGLWLGFGVVSILFRWQNGYLVGLS